jgi:hypothetical protein
MNFDELVLDYAIKSIEDLTGKLKKMGIDNPRLTAESTLSSLKNIHSNNSLKPKYQTIFNQCIVLLVAYFSSTVSDIFKVALKEKLCKGELGQLSKEEVKISLGELRDMDFNLSEYIGDVVANKKEISFQDMQSITRAFKEYLGVEIQKDTVVNNIIVGQASRHAFVHSGGTIDARLLKQISNATPRDIKETCNLGDTITFSTEEITMVAESMKKYIEKAITQIEHVGQDWCKQ